jgi:eukaryotic-like serine/threonine-protein kinase
LLDEQGEPHIADFGLAVSLDPKGSYSHAAGTPGYMSPEQAASSRECLTFVADIYSLGAVLYQLLTGQVPFETPPEQMMTRIRGPEPATPPSQIVRGIPPALEAVCLKCLEKEPAYRYQSAGLLAADLRCVVEGRPISIVPPSAWGKVVHFARRNPEVLTRLVGAALGVVVALAWLIGGWQFAARSERATVSTNAMFASALAGASLAQLREYADRVQQAAKDPDVVAATTRDGMTTVEPAAIQRLAKGNDAAFVLSTEGKVLSQVPLPEQTLWDSSYDFRDYFKCAQRLGAIASGGACVARAFLSERDAELKYGVAAPVFRNGRWAGVVVMSIAADSVFGKVRDRSIPDGYVTALLGPRDDERGGSSQPDPGNAPLVFLFHDGLRRGTEVSAPHLPHLPLDFRTRATEQFVLRPLPPHIESDYRDPVAGFGGPWLAAFAPVGGTGYIAVVQTPRSAFLEWVRWKLSASALLLAGLAFLLSSVRKWSKKRAALQHSR